MAWIILVLSGLFEAVWATALAKIDSWRDLAPITAFALGGFVSLAGLAYAMREIPTGTAYAIWVAVGAAATVAYAVATGEEPFSVAKLLLMLGLIGCVVGLKLVGDH